MNIKFLKGSLERYQALVTAGTIDVNTLYFITDTGALYLGEKLIGKDYDASILALQNLIGEVPKEYASLREYVDSIVTGSGYVTVTAMEAAIKAEADRAKEIEEGLRTDVDAIKDDYLQAEDKTELEGKINNKVDKVEGKSLISDTEIARLANVDNYDDAVVRGLIDAVEEDIAEINNVDSGILAQAKAYTDEVKDSILGEDISTTYDTLKEIQDWIEGDGVNATELTQAIAVETKNRQDADTALAGRVKAIEDLGLVENYALKSEVQAVDNKLANYVEKEGYIAYTQEEKNKLANLNNYNDTEVRGLISGLDGRISTIEDKPAMDITADNISTWNGKTTLAEVKETYIGNTSVTLAAVVAAVNQLYDGSEGVNNELKSMNQNVKALENALTWGDIPTNN